MTDRPPCPLPAEAAAPADNLPTPRDRHSEGKDRSKAQSKGRTFTRNEKVLTGEQAGVDGTRPVLVSERNTDDRFSFKPWPPDRARTAVSEHPQAATVGVRERRPQPGIDLREGAICGQTP